VQIDGPTWETIKGISVDMEGESVFPLLPKVNNVAHLLVCDVTLEDKMKIVTLRSPNVVVNHTAIAVEIMIVNDAQQQVGSLTRIEAAGNSPVPLGSGFYNSVRVRPEGFGYKWSQLVSWKHLLKEKMSMIYLLLECNPQLTLKSADFL
jgi:vacuolar protein sorting-associated protein 13A/C